jgi:hypothetical protein
MWIPGLLGSDSLGEVASRTSGARVMEGAEVMDKECEEPIGEKEGAVCEHEDVATKGSLRMAETRRLEPMWMGWRNSSE